MISDLRNPSLKKRHWELIEGIVGHKFDPEVTLTLQKLTELNVFEHAEAIQEVSGQASSESSLEAILKKVRTFTGICTYSGMLVCYCLSLHCICNRC